MSHPPSYEELSALWGDHQGNQKRLTYNDLRVCSNTIAHFLDSLRIFPRPPGWPSQIPAIGTMPLDTRPDSWQRQFTSFVLNTFMNVKENL
jgi:hypothetical protein